MKLSASVLALALTAVVAMPTAQAPQLLDPVGKWTVTTVSDEGQPMTVSLDITGKPGAYSGTAMIGPDTALPLRDLATTPNGMLMLFDTPDSTIVVRVTREGGKFTGVWGELTQFHALTAERGK